ncbi:MAG: hypothetical protein DWQ31_12840 [Planctomycetota bacterium]|nr:MAG: hypothetical protein DWQ31_12840 [Planctomycetota bacterium]REJ91814.1 MAG: hypothetical protein DWQ35_14020 [Planctomycetota bacterium]
MTRRTNRLVRDRIDRRTGTAALVVFLVLAAGWQSAVGSPVRRAIRGGEVTDSQGFLWDFHPNNGSFRRGTNRRAFNNACVLSLNGNTVSFNKNQITFVGGELLLFGQSGTLQVQRRVKIDTEKSVVRYVDTFRNPGAAAVTLMVTLTTNLFDTPQSILTDTGGNFAGALTKEDSGLALVQNHQGRAPSLLLYLPHHPKKATAAMQVHNSNRSFVTNYQLVIPAQQSVALTHGIAQRNLGGKDSAAIAKEFDPFKHRDWLEGLPTEMRRSIVNRRQPFYLDDDDARFRLTDEIRALAAAWEVEPSADEDILVLDEESQLRGTFESEPLTLRTRYGELTVQLEEVAAIVGGGKNTSEAQLFFHSGEIFGGELADVDWNFASAEGLTATPQPAQISALFLRLPAASAESPPTTPALVKTVWGDRIAIAESANPEIALASAWGSFAVKLREIRGLFPVRDPQPRFLLSLVDGSRLHVIPQQPTLALETTRFGAIQLASSEVTLLSGAPLEKRTRKNDQERASRVPLLFLRGENRLVCRLASEQLEVETDTADVMIDTATLLSLERTAEPPAAVFRFRTARQGEREITGALRAIAIPVEFRGTRWAIPVRHLNHFRQPAPASDEETAEDDTAPTPTEGVLVPRALRDRPTGRGIRKPLSQDA